MRFFSMLSTAKTCSPAAGSSIFSARWNTSQCPRDRFSRETQFYSNEQYNVLHANSYVIDVTLRRGGVEAGQRLCRGFTE